MKSKSIKIILPCMMLLAFSHISLAQVSIALTQPPSEKWNIESLWNLTLTNLSANPQNVYLFGTVEEMNKGMIVECTTSAFIIAANYIGTVSYVDLLPVDINYIGDENYQEIYVQTNSLPAGTYTICVYVKDVKTATELAKDCYVLYISHPSPPELIIPTDKAEISEAYPNFLWLPTISTISTDINYTLKVVELLDEQIPYEAMESNLSWFKEKGIPLTSFQYPISARQMEAGKNYAWQVTAFSNNHEIGKSEVWSFMFNPQFARWRIQLDTLEVSCTDVMGIYNFTLKFRNLNDPATNSAYGNDSYLVNWNIVLPTDATIINPLVPPALGSFPYNPSATYSVSGTISCSSPLTSVTMMVEMANNLNPIPGYMDQASIIDTIAPCPCDDCDSRHFIFLASKPLQIIFSDTILSFNQNITINTSPTKTIKSIVAELVYFSMVPENSYCIPCNKDAAKYGHFINGTNSMRWESMPKSFNFDITTPKLTPCCDAVFEWCIRYKIEFTDCTSCNKLLCYKKKIEGCVEVNVEDINQQINNNNNIK